MKTQIQINCPDCHSPSLKKNGKKSYGKQNYQCKDCKRQFIGDHALTYNGCHSRIEDKIRLMTVRGWRREFPKLCVTAYNPLTGE
ncbi:MAG: hypothetical protein L0G63_13625, partial [Psychrobacter sp.]|uniref:IS1/IS1595 family N-terminal zinc-binding domain-containing protein n=1 Tax=Psychrobacter sp. TaxID=56811 RepID=UPI002656A494|nr:hypothetical protein [Psychrobacter sp.]